MGRVGVCKELGDEAGFEDNLIEGAIGVAHCRDETSLLVTCELESCIQEGRSVGDNIPG